MPRGVEEQGAATTRAGIALDIPCRHRAARRERRERRVRIDDLLFPQTPVEDRQIAACLRVQRLRAEDLNQTAPAFSRIVGNPAEPVPGFNELRGRWVVA